MDNKYNTRSAVSELDRRQVDKLIAKAAARSIRYTADDIHLPYAIQICIGKNTIQFMEYRKVKGTSDVLECHSEILQLTPDMRIQCIRDMLRALYQAKEASDASEQQQLQSYATISRHAAAIACAADMFGYNEALQLFEQYDVDMIKQL